VGLLGRGDDENFPYSGKGYLVSFIIYELLLSCLLFPFCSWLRVGQQHTFYCTNWASPLCDELLHIVCLCIIPLLLFTLSSIIPHNFISPTRGVIAYTFTVKLIDKVNLLLDLMLHHGKYWIKSYRWGKISAAHWILMH